MQEAIKDVEIIFAIPKFHLPAHGFKCWSLFSLNYIKGSARVDGEAIERFWSLTNPVATSTREMAPGARHDYLEERWRTANFRKMVELGTSLATKLREAVKGRDKHTQELAEFSSSFEEEILVQWREAVELWHRDPVNHLDPYQVQTAGKLFGYSIASVDANCILEFTLADIVAELRAENTPPSGTYQGPEVNETDFLIMALDIEYQQ
jgi:hypothetical protein